MATISTSSEAPKRLDELTIESANKAVSEPRMLKGDERAVMWEIKKAKGYMESFEKLLGAHSIILSLLASVNLVAFLQPPKGWNVSTGVDSQLNGKSVMYNTGSIEAFAISNSLSLYAAISGLLFYLYCSHVGMLSMAPMEVPTSEYDERGIAILHEVRAYLRCVGLPSVRRRANILFSFVACSLVFSVMGFIASGYAATSPDERLHYVVLPAIPGCGSLLFFLVLALRKQCVKMNFDQQLDNFWKYAVCFADDDIPPVVRLEPTVRKELDHIPLHFLTCFFVKADCCPRNGKHPSHKHH